MIDELEPMTLPKPSPLADFTDRPATGTGCALCKERGHFCPAKGFLGDDPVCLECGMGEPCSQAAAVERFHKGYGEFEVETPPAECRQIPLDQVDQTAEREEPVSAWSIKDSLSADNLRREKRPRAIVKPPAVRAAAPQPIVEVAEPVVEPTIEPTAPFTVEPMEEPEMNRLCAVKVCKTQLAANNTTGRCTPHYYVKKGTEMRDGSVWGGAVTKKPATPKKQGNTVNVNTAPPIVRDVIKAALADGSLVRPTELVMLPVPVASLDSFWMRLTVEDKVRIVSAEMVRTLS